MAEGILPGGWEEYETEQLRWIARNTTPQQRFDWLCDTLDVLGDRLPKRIEVKALCEAANRSLQDKKG